MHICKRAYIKYCVLFGNKWSVCVCVCDIYLNLFSISTAYLFVSHRDKLLKEVVSFSLSVNRYQNCHRHLGSCAFFYVYLFLAGNMMCLYLNLIFFLRNLMPFDRSLQLEKSRKSSRKKRNIFNAFRTETYSCSAWRHLMMVQFVLKTHVIKFLTSTDYMNINGVFKLV